MGLLEQEIIELRQMNKQLMAGKISNEMVNARIAIYSQVHKRTTAMLQAFAIAAKHNKYSLNRIMSTNLIGNGQAIELETSPGDEKIICPLNDKFITRDFCLDYSGSHMDECAGCPNKKITQDILL